jgi:hypothetical protein
VGGVVMVEVGAAVGVKDAEDCVKKWEKWEKQQLILILLQV